MYSKRPVGPSDGGPGPKLVPSWARAACHVCGQAAEHPAGMTTQPTLRAGSDSHPPDAVSRPIGGARHAMITLMGWKCVVRSPAARDQREQKERNVRWAQMAQMGYRNAMQQRIRHHSQRNHSSIPPQKPARTHTIIPQLALCLDSGTPVAAVSFGLSLAYESAAPHGCFPSLAAPSFVPSVVTTQAHSLEALGRWDPRYTPHSLTGSPV
ncbi:hypothetical protein N431DRAFT_450204 [Stipitochalara longipes BDJ]|nr:hypothetical protein N431DRAFT_450204 [Stipitochalara longipes BDJ]